MTSSTRLAPARLAALVALGTIAAADPLPLTAPSSPAPPNPALAEVPLAANAGWNATLVLDNRGVGIWTVEAFQVFPQTGTPELVGLDDRGRVKVCAGYSGKWTPTTVVSDGKWLGGLAHADVDPRIAGAETYTGSQQGNLYQVVAWPHGVLDYRLIAHLPGREIHTLVAGDVDAASPGPEVLVFTRPGGLYRVTPSGPNGTFETRELAPYDGRVRQALVLPAGTNAPPDILTVSHNGRLERLRLTAAGPQWRTLHQDAMGLGRVALRPGPPGQPPVLYTTQDDGRILRHEPRGADEWFTETIYLGPQGPRGVAAGPFGETPETETVAIFGYSRKVELLTRTASGWRAETIFEDLDKGHWLASAELDGRNATRELVTSGYSGRLVLLARPPGYGRTEAPFRATGGPQATVEPFDALAPDGLPGGWTPLITGSGTPVWRVESDPTAPSPPHVLRQSGLVPKPSFPLSLVDASRLRDGFVEAKFKTLGGTIDQAAGLVWRARDAANYYVCRANALENNVVLYKLENGQRTPLDIVGRTGGYGVEAKVPSGQWQTLRVEFVGPRFRVFLDGRELFTVEDASFAEAGKVGLWTKADSVTAFDDFRWGAD
jgi:hypothetical protein